MTIKVSDLIPPAFRSGYFRNFTGRYRVFKGARNTGKSHSIIGFESILKILSDDRRNVLIIRQNENSNRGTTFENVRGRISDLGLDGLFRIREFPSLEITYVPTGQRIVFKGMNDPTKLNGITFAHGFLTDVYVDEAFELVSYDDFRKLDGSLRGKLPPGLSLQITLCFNAWSSDHWIYPLFFRGRLDDDFEYLSRPDVDHAEFTDPTWQGDYGRGLYLNTSTWKANPYRDVEATDAAAAALAVRSPEIHRVEYLGMWGNATESTYPEFDVVRHVVPAAELRARGYISYAIGIDTGLSDGEGKHRRVRANQDVSERVKSAHAVMLVGLRDDYSGISVLDEYYHTEIRRNGHYNTDDPFPCGEPELVRRTADVVLRWRDELGYIPPIFVDSADRGFRDGLADEFARRGEYASDLFASAKLPTDVRVSFERLAMAWDEFPISDSCPNAIREFKNARRSPDGRPRTDDDDHCLTALEYAFTPLLPEVRRWREFKPSKPIPTTDPNPEL